MDAQGRGGAGDIDPADQWVLNPETGNYELRLPGARQPGRPGGAGGRGQRPAGDAGSAAEGGARSARNTPPRQRRAPSSSPGDSAPPKAGDKPVPGQRDRRAQVNRRRGKNVKKRRSRTRRVLTWLGGTVAMLVLIASLGAWYLWERLNGNLTRVDAGVSADYGDGDPVNILFIGTDSRTGEGNDSYGGDASEGNDTTILMHFSANREHATGLSIPRDMITDIPECEVTNDDGTTETIPASEGVRFNQSMGALGRDPSCVVNSVQEMTGVTINHLIMADFNAVKDLSSAVGGVPICLEEPIDDPKSGLDLAAGDHTVEGEEALSFVRTRYGVGNGGDLDRIKLQQQFVASMARQITDGGILSSPTRLLELADAATRALTVDDEISNVNDLRLLAEDVGRVPMSDMNFVTVPVVDNPDEPEDARATVVLDEGRAAPIFRMIQEDIDPNQAAEEEAAAEEAAAEPVPAAEVRVDVYNGGDVIGAAQQTLDWLQNVQGMPLSTNKSNAPESQETTTLEYGADQAGQAATLAEVMGLPNAALQQVDEDRGDTPMVLVLGNDFRGPGQPIEIPAELPDDVDSITADDESVCAS
ncbi:LytR family transcriptional regulator [Streptomyces hainanensis]|uniref:LytR family transcriptional regulator n=1 Tax=Streptomyces hainanensis TaxID=402648 RepID=A0A4R4SWP6_9ACTN|nr:LCP family protein [Streptomyces hainanensis]TDC68587.1 LytR family transcriptional regulator [Streptomyces hainanensis]